VSAGEASFSGNASSGFLTVNDGTHSALIHLTGDYLGDSFVAASDGKGGVTVTAMAAATSSARTFAAAMAGFGAGAAASPEPPDLHARDRATLFAPPARGSHLP
jgi:hypothetical protein